MAKVGAQRAAELTGKSKSTIQRAMNAGKITFELDRNGRKRVDVVELERVFGLVKQNNDNNGQSPVPSNNIDALVALERHKARIQMLEEQLQKAEEQISDIKTQRDQWHEQASQALITSQFAQKQYQSLHDNIRERERRAHERRQKRLKEQGKRSIKPENQNVRSSANDKEPSNEGGHFFLSFWQKLKENF